ncbi:MAG TPA: hypothetical protein VIQ03_03325 [Gammaproteobacteria bacterium]
MTNKRLITLLLFLLTMPMVVLAAQVETLKVGKDHFYFNGVKSTSVHGLGSVIEEYKNTRIIVFLCTNGDSKKLIEVMAFLEQKGISEVTLKSSKEVTNC